MDAGLAIAVLLALAFAVTNGLHDASNAIATLVATRAARPSQAIVLATVFNLLGPLLLGAAVADTIGGIVTVSPSEAVAVIGSGLAAADGLEPDHLAARAALELGSRPGRRAGRGGRRRGGVHAVNWGGIDGLHPVGRLRDADRAGGLAGARRARRAARDPRLCAGSRGAPPERWHGAGPGRPVGDVGGARLQPRRQRRAEVGRRDRCAAARRRADRLALGAHLGDRRLRRAR